MESVRLAVDADVSVSSTDTVRAIVDPIPLTDDGSDSALLGAPEQREQNRGLYQLSTREVEV